MSALIWVYWIIAIAFFVMAIIQFIAIFSMWRLLNEIVLSGAIPKVLEERAKRNAREILKMGYIENPKRTIEISQILSRLSNDREATQLVHKLDELKKQQAR